MPDAEAARAARKAAVGDQRHLLAQPLAIERRGGRQHLPHARAALGSLIADDDDRPLLDRIAASTAAKASSSRSNTRAVPVNWRRFIPATFTIAPSGASEPRQPDHAAGRRDRRPGIVDDLLVGVPGDLDRCSRPASSPSPSGSPGAGSPRPRASSSACICRPHRACRLRDIAAAGLEIGDIGRALEDLGHVEQVERRCPPHWPSPASGARRWSSRRSRRRCARHSRRLRACRCRAGGCSERSVPSPGGPQPPRSPHVIYKAPGAMLLLGKRQADRLADAGHGVGGILAAARAVPWASRLLDRGGLRESGHLPAA